MNDEDAQSDRAVAYACDGNSAAGTAVIGGRTVDAIRVEGDSDVR